MALRDRQIGGIPLTKGQAAVLTLIAAFVVIPFMWFFVWAHVFSFIPEDVHLYIVIAGIALYLGECFSVVPVDKERTLLFFGSYTGVSFPAGICLTPRLPFPVITFFLKVFLGEEVYKYLGWVLEGDALLHSISVTVEGEGISSDGVRLHFNFLAVAEVENVAIFRSQTSNEDAEDEMKKSLGVDIADYVRGVVSRNLVRDFIQGNHESLSSVLTSSVQSVRNYGLSVRSIVAKSIKIISSKVEEAFDFVAAKDLFNQAALLNAVNFAQFLKELKKEYPQIDETTALVLFQSSRGQSLSGLNIFTMPKK